MHSCVHTYVCWHVNDSHMHTVTQCVSLHVHTCMCPNCVCAIVCVCMRMPVCLCTRACVPTVCTQSCVCACTCLCNRLFTHARAHGTCVHTHMCTCLTLSMHVCACARVHLYECTCPRSPFARAGSHLIDKHARVMLASGPHSEGVDANEGQLRQAA